MRRPTIRRENPGSDLPRRIMAHMLGVPALKICDPMVFGVLMESHNAPFH
jgi:hypothetical protein